jgi:hypothetical protein
MTSARGRIASVADGMDALAAQRAPLLARIEAIGTGETRPGEPEGELAAALRAAESARRSARQALNMTFPDRPEAADDARAARIEAILDGLQDRVAGQAAAQRQQPRAQVVIPR